MSDTPDADTPPARKAAPAAPALDGLKHPAAAAAPDPFPLPPPMAAAPVPAAMLPDPARLKSDLTGWGKVSAYAQTLCRTFYKSILAPCFWAALIAAIAYSLLVLAFARPELATAWLARDAAPLFAGAGARIAAAACALGAGTVAVLGLSEYLFAGRTFLQRALLKNIKASRLDDPLIYVRYSAQTLQSYHHVLRFAGAFAFVCELALQTAAFGVVTWGVATAFPAAMIFTNPESLNLQNAIWFWSERVFALVDGPNIFDVRLSPLTPNKSTWGFGLMILFYKLFVLSVVVRLFQDSINLKPADISVDWDAAVNRRRDPFTA